MASLKFFLDTRRRKKDGSSQLKIGVNHKHASRYVSLGIYLQPDHWDVARCRVRSTHPQATKINKILVLIKSNADGALLDLIAAGEAFDIDQLRDAVGSVVNPTLYENSEKADPNLLVPMFERFAALKKASTRMTYDRTLTHIKSYCSQYDRLRFDDVTRMWLMEFDAHMAKTAPSANSRAIHMRNLRAVFNFAIDEGITTCYPFRKFHIKTVRTAKRSLSVDDLHRLKEMPVDAWIEPYRKFFFLSFFLIGINPVDLLHLRHSDIHDGRIEYNRAKTSRLYSIKLEPEALELIETMRGTDHLLDILDNRSDYLQFVRQVNHALKSIGTGSRPGRKGSSPALFPDISMYWARHTWATIAASLDIPKETISAALGHGGSTVTDIYIDFDRRKVDEANRRVIDWVLYGRR